MSQLIDFSEVGKTLTESKRRVKSDPTKKLISRLCRVTNTRSEMAVLVGVNEVDASQQDLNLCYELMLCYDLNLCFMTCKQQKNK